MTELAFKGPSADQLRRRHLAEKRFRLFAISSVFLGLAFLGVLFIIVAISGADAVRQAKMLLTISLDVDEFCLLYTSPSPRDATLSRMPSSA